MECVLTPHSDRNGRGVRGAQNGIFFVGCRSTAPRSALHGHPARSCPPVVASTAFPYFPSLPPRTRTCPASDRFRPSTQKKTGSSLRLPGFCKRKIITPVFGGKWHDITERLVAEVIHPAV